MRERLPQFQRFVDDPPYKKIHPGNIYEFREIPVTATINLPEIAKNRKCTDVAFIILFVICIFIMIGFSVYFYVEASKLNKQEIQFKGEDRSYNEDDNNNDNNDIYTDLKYNATQNSEDEVIDTNLLFLTVGAMMLTAFVLCYLLFLCFLCNVRRTFWALLIFQVICLTVVAICGCLLYVFNASLIAGLSAMTSVIILVAVIALICWMSRKFKLIILIYEEAFSAIFTIKALLIQPLMTMAVLAIINVPVLIFIIKVLEFSDSVYDSGIFQIYTSCLSIIILWIYTFITGSQCIVVAGTVAAYYFARNKSQLHSPFFNSICIFTRFHLGTVAAGSLIITIITVIKNLSESAKRKKEQNAAVAIIVCLISCCLECLEEIVQYLTKKAYIMTAIHGKALCPSGKRGARLLWMNLLDVVAVDGIGGLGIAGAGFLILMICMGVGIGINYAGLKKSAKFIQFDKIDKIIFFLIFSHFLKKVFDVSGSLTPLWILMIGLYLSGVVIIMYLQLMTVTIETMFLCFCEDKLLNDGSRERPYYMSPGLLQIMETAFERNEDRNPNDPPN